jgi:hypothetical protein
MFIGVPLCNPRKGGCIGASAQTAWGSGARETLKPWMPHPGETYNGPGQAIVSRVDHSTSTIIYHLSIALLTISHQDDRIIKD